MENIVGAFVVPVRSTLDGVPEQEMPQLPCPECRERGQSGGCRIGNRRNECATCNAFAQRVMRLTRKRLKELHAEEYLQVRLETELELYPQVLSDFERSHPESLEA